MIEFEFKEPTLLDDDLQMVRRQLRRFVQDRIIPFGDDWEAAGETPRSLFRELGAMGYLGMRHPVEYGGGGLGALSSVILGEELSRSGYGGVASALTVHSDMSIAHIAHRGTPAQKQKYLPAACAGEKVGAVCVTEPGAGSDVAGLKTRAVRQDDGWVINGSKTFITNGQNADLIIVVTKTSPKDGAKGTSLFLVEGDRPGFKRGRNLEKLGMHAQDTSELFFEDVRVPATNMLGGEGQGFFLLMQELPWERLQIAISAVANCEAAIEWTADYVKNRQAFGQPIAKFQNTKFKLAELKTETQIARVFVDKCLELICKKQLDVTTAAMAKYWCSDLQNKVLDECLQLHGGYGFMWEYPIARAYADARVQRIYGGTNEIMKELIGRTI